MTRKQFMDRKNAFRGSLTVTVHWPPHETQHSAMQMDGKRGAEQCPRDTSGIKG